MTLHNVSREQLVCEVDVVPTAGWFTWYEVPIAHGGEEPPPVGKQHVIAAATETIAEHSLRDAVGVLAPGVTHVQFEAALGHASAARIVADIRDRGFSPIPASHLTGPMDAARLYDLARRLADLGSPIVKIVYPAMNPESLAAGLSVLDRWSGSPRLSLTPAGSRGGRLAAALAGSALVFVPLRPEPERLPAAWWRELVSPTSQADDEQETS